MKNPLQLTINVVLLLAVAALYYLHFSHPVAAPAIATDKSVAVLASPDLNTADTTAAAAADTAPAATAPESAMPVAPVADATGNFEGKLAWKRPLPRQPVTP